jgi:2-amino-4-hydroxy-6-hydroxymethyldihydropteridine diphosphokinase
MKQAKAMGTSVYVGCGANLGDRKRTIERAIALLAKVPGIRVVRISSLYQTEPVGGPSQPLFLNCVLKLKVALSPRRLLSVLKDIERSLGRRKGLRWGPRSIDLDILAFGNRRISSKRLVIPHPRYHSRRFVLVPFCELAPSFVHPIIRKNNTSLLRRLTPLGQRVTILAKWKKSRFYLYKKRSAKSSRWSR